MKRMNRKLAACEYGIGKQTLAAYHLSQLER